MKQRITVLLVDDHALVRRGFRRLLEDDAALEVVGEASSGEDAVAQFAALRPRVVVMDSAMPGMSGIAATRVILGQDPGARVLMLSMHSEETLVRQALATGARGYVLKSALDLDLAAAIKKVDAGEVLVDAAISRETRPGERVMRHLPSAVPTERASRRRRRSARGSEAGRSTTTAPPAPDCDAASRSRPRPGLDRLAPPAGR